MSADKRIIDSDNKNDSIKKKIAAYLKEIHSPIESNYLFKNGTQKERNLYGENQEFLQKQQLIVSNYNRHRNPKGASLSLIALPKIQYKLQQKSKREDIHLNNQEDSFDKQKQNMKKESPKKIVKNEQVKRKEECSKKQKEEVNTKSQNDIVNSFSSRESKEKVIAVENEIYNQYASKSNNYEHSISINNSESQQPNNFSLNSINNSAYLKKNNFLLQQIKRKFSQQETDATGGCNSISSFLQDDGIYEQSEVKEDQLQEGKHNLSNQIKKVLNEPSQQGNNENYWLAFQQNFSDQINTQKLIGNHSKHLSLASHRQQFSSSALKKENNQIFSYNQPLFSSISQSSLFNSSRSINSVEPKPEQLCLFKRVASEYIIQEEETKYKSPQSDRSSQTKNQWSVANQQAEKKREAEFVESSKDKACKIMKICSKVSSKRNKSQELFEVEKVRKQLNKQYRKVLKAYNEFNIDGSQKKIQILKASDRKNSCQSLPKIEKIESKNNQSNNESCNQSNISPKIIKIKRKKQNSQDNHELLTADLKAYLRELANKSQIPQNSNNKPELERRLYNSNPNNSQVSHYHSSNTDFLRRRLNKNKFKENSFTAQQDRIMSKYVDQVEFIGFES